MGVVVAYRWERGSVCFALFEPGGHDAGTLTLAQPRKRLSV